MNTNIEKLLTDLEKSRFFGTVEIMYQNGVPGHASVKRTYKFNNTTENNAPNRENRGDGHGQSNNTR